MLYILFICTLLLLTFSYVIFDRDFSHPSFIFCLAFAFFELVCVAFANANAVTIGPETAMIILGGMMIFIAFGVFAKYLEQRTCPGNTEYRSEHRYIDLSNVIVVLVIICQLITIYVYIRYLHRLYIAYYGKAGSLSACINLCDQLTKFNTDDYNALKVRPGSLYNRTNLISSSVPYLIIFTLVNNFIVRKKINVFQLFSAALVAVRIYLSGARSALLILFVMIVLQVYITKYRKPVGKKSGAGFVIKIFLATLAFGAVSIGLLELMGRSGPSNIGHYLYVYLGAPIDNLDNYIQGGSVMMKDTLFGQHTFGRFYEYFQQKNLVDSSLGTVTDVLPFVKTANGNTAGNVFTMYYFFLIDFGYAGIVPLTLIITVFYTILYYKTRYRSNAAAGMSRTRAESFPYAVFIYTYLANNLVMTPFSNRFYEDVVSIAFLKFVIITGLFTAVFINGRLKIGNTNIIFFKKKNYMIS